MLEHELDEGQSIEDIGPLSLEDLRNIRLYWRAANYLALGQVFLVDNPLLKEPLEFSHLKTDTFSFWGTIPGINFIYAHLNRLIRQHNLEMLLIAGPGHGCAALRANAFLEGTLGSIDDDMQLGVSGIRRLFQGFSYHTFANDAAALPGSIQAGYELGYSLAHAYGAVLDNPDLIAACIVGDGEAETGTLAASWPLRACLSATTNGVVLPILHLNSYKVSKLSLFASMATEQLLAFFSSLGYKPYLVEGGAPEVVHQLMAKACDSAIADIKSIREEARDRTVVEVSWPVILLRTPKGWTGPKKLDGEGLEGLATAYRLEHFRQNNALEFKNIIERWLVSYGVESLFSSDGLLREPLAATIPPPEKTLSISAHANGGSIRAALNLPSAGDYELPVQAGLGSTALFEARSLGAYLREVLSLNRVQFRIFSSDGSNLGQFLALRSLLESNADVVRIQAESVFLRERTIEILSQQVCQSLLEGYLLTGRHGLYICSEQYVNNLVSVLGNFAHWLDRAKSIEWRQAISSFNYLIVSRLWSPDSRRALLNPGLVLAAMAMPYKNVYLFFPPDQNSALAALEICLKSTDAVNLMVVDAHSQDNWITIEQARQHLIDGVSVWSWVGSESAEGPAVVMAACGAVPTREALQAVELLRAHMPDISIRVVNVVNLNRLQLPEVHPAGLNAERFNDFFPAGCPVVFAYHGFASDIYALMGQRLERNSWSVHGYQGSSVSGSEFEHLLANRLDRYSLAIALLDNLVASNYDSANVRSLILQMMKSDKTA